MTLLEALARLDATDFRVKGRTRHKASEIAAITVCSLMSGGTSYYDFAEFGREREKWLRGFLELENGIPSHDTFRRFWQELAPARLNACFFAWIETWAADPAGDTIHLDGKCLRRAYWEDGRQPCIVSAYSSREKIAIGQVKADEKSNEITALPELIRMLVLLGAIVTIDAAGCQKKVVRAIVGKGGDYLIALKGNQTTMHEEIKELFATTFRNRDEVFKSAAATDKGHGRVTTWKCEQTAYIGWFADKDKWAGLKSVVKVETETFRQKTGATTRDERYFISSLGVDPERALQAARSHWDVENPLHWVLDMVFDEDHSRARSGHSAENLAIMRHMAYNATRKSAATKGGMKRRKKSLTWNPEKLLATLRAA